MGNSLRCCLACILPCGALDLIRIVHLNGFMEEIASPITAQEVLKNNPNHVLSKPSSQGVVRRILILSPKTELKRGSIYFLIPESSLPDNKKTRSLTKKQSSSPEKASNKKCSSTDGRIHSDHCDSHSKDVKSGKKSSSSSRRDRRRGRVGVWRPHLEIISED